LRLLTLKLRIKP